MAAPVFEPLNSVIDTVQLHCLNEANNHKAKDFFKGQLEGQANTLESDCDEQLLIVIPFSSAVRISSLIIAGPEEFAPSHLKLFINKPSFDFDNAESMPAVQDVILKKDDTKGDGKEIQLKYVKFQNVTSLIIFVDKNHGNKDKTTISKLVVMGQEIKVEGTKMDTKNAATNSRVSATELLDKY
eukprot:TRINITY_DN1649_c2_g1_i1.p2 TRINITY_DN1649_c2_g1~~TRINITY_DN1649_c2_g1_i1.p2  ORF type:complete len:184 (-),score=46.26 TRINITY_DN1649_c2_g1_i1:620-1171(-)